MKKYLLPTLGGFGIVAAGAFLAPAAAYADSYVPVDPCPHGCASSVVNVPDGGLADTGSTFPMALFGGAAVAIVAGGTVLVVRRKARKSE